MINSTGMKDFQDVPLNSSVNPVIQKDTDLSGCSCRYSYHNNNARTGSRMSNYELIKVLKLIVVLPCHSTNSKTWNLCDAVFERKLVSNAIMNCNVDEKRRHHVVESDCEKREATTKTTTMHRLRRRAAPIF